MKNETYLPALGYDRLTPFYDAVVRLTTRETVFKKALVEQVKFEPRQNILDLACGTGTLTILIEKNSPSACNGVSFVALKGRKFLENSLVLPLWAKIFGRIPRQLAAG